MNKKRLVILNVLLILSLCVLPAVDVIIPAMGMMQSHNMATDEEVYKNLEDKKTPPGGISAYDNLAVALCQGYKYGSGDERKFTVEVSYDSNGLYFVSDDNPVYKRPFELYIIKRQSGSYTPYAYKIGAESFTVTALNGTPDAIWVDIVIQLPGTKTDGGIKTDDGTFYPLIQGNYTAMFNVELTSSGGSVQSMNIVVPGYYSNANVASSNAAALKVTPFANSVNLNLASMIRNPSSAVEVGEIDFLYRQSGRVSSPTLDDGTSKFYLFLSASPDPYSSAVHGFKLVHESFVMGEDFYNDSNSLDYVVELRGDADHSGLNQTFDGTDYLNSDNKVQNYIKTQCHKEMNYQGLGNNTYVHYHTYGGTVSVRLEDVAASQNPSILYSGRYSSYIYVHIIEAADE